MEIQQIPKVPPAEFRYERLYTKKGVHPYDTVKWEVRDAKITDQKGLVIFEQRGVEVPSFWSQTATNIVASKYFRGKLGTPEREFSARQLVDRVAKTITGWGRQGKYFLDDEEARTFEAELIHILLYQMAAFNSPVWFNVGVEERPQCSACFINSVQDDMRSIMQLAVTEGMLFKYGSGCTGARSFVWTTFCGLEQMEKLWQRLERESPEVCDTEGYSSYIEPHGPIYTLALRADGTFVRDRIEKMWKFTVRPEDKLRILTTKGAEALVSAWHPCMVLDHGKIAERRADQVRPGDLLVGPNRTVEESWPFTGYQRVRYSFENFGKRVEEETVVDETLAWLVGYFIGDGGIGRGNYRRLRTGTTSLRVRFWDETRDNLERVKRVLKERFGAEGSVTWNLPGKSAALMITVTKARAVGFFELIAPPGRKSNTIILPDWAFKSPLSVVRALVAGMLDSDGTVSTDKGGVRATLTTASPRLAEQLRALVAYLGWATTNAQVTSKDGPWRSVTILSRNTKGMVKRAIAIHMSHPHRRHRLESAQDPPNGLWKRDGLPWKALGLDEIVSDPKLESFRRSYRSSLKFEARGSRFYLAPARSQNRIGRGRLQAFLYAMLPHLSPPARTRAELLLRVMDGLDEVRGIESGSEDSLPFYDFELASEHTYLAGERGMITIHNTGSNLSTLRSSKEHLSTGGRASGPVSFMKGFDAFAGVIKSGGRTRRAAKMVILNVDHPDIVDFIWSKANEEKKAWALIDAGYDSSVDGEAYGSVFFQNANHSVRVTDDFMHSALEDKEWKTRYITNRQVAETHQARDLLRQMAEAAYVCGDPGIQFDTTVNKWHPCPVTGRINASNPCSEYMFLDDSACNLASLNLMKFRTPEGEFDVKSFEHAAGIIISAQEILVDNASYPTPTIEKNSHDYRPLGLGYANLGALLMARGLPYDSDEGRNYAAAISALMSGHAYAISSLIAKRLGPFRGYSANEKPFLNVIDRHRTHAYKIPPSDVPKELWESAVKSWDDALSLGERFGFKNAQISVIAPTGTIAFLMDCDTTGIEPDIALVKYKWLVGGGVIKIANNTVPEALARLSYSKSQTEEILQYLEDHDTIEGAPNLKPEHLPVFDCAFKPAKGTRSIHYMGHVKMMAAVQPFISGAISKTVNMPNDVSVEEIVETYVTAWKMGLKAIAIYRDGSKRTQPLTTTKEKEAEKELKPAEVVYKPLRRKLPDERQAVTHKFTINGSEGYITVGLYNDASPGEIFVKMSKQGSTLSGLMDAFSISISLALQYGVPLKVLVGKFTHTRFEPSGFTNNPEIRIAKSVVDYIFRWLGLKYLSKEDQESIGLTMTAEENRETQVKLVEPIVRNQPEPRPVSRASSKRQGPDFVTFDPQSDAPPCDNCGMIMVRNGSCYKCLNCGNTSGCG